MSEWVGPNARSTSDVPFRVVTGGEWIYIETDVVRLQLAKSAARHLAERLLALANEGGDR